MTDSNRTQLAGVKEVTVGTTPGTPRMRKIRFTGEGLSFKPTFVESDEIRDDRNKADPIKVGETNDGPVNVELIYPVADSLLASAYESAFQAAWANTPTRDNDGTADSVITGVTASTGVITVTTGAAFVARQLIKTTGFTNAGNNGLFVITTGSATAPAVGASLLTDEAAPPAAARMKVVGFQGAAGDIETTSEGLISSSLDFTTLGLIPGMWLKVGGTGAGYRFATAANNGWARISGTITANLIPLDNLPSGWTTDDGSGLTIRVFTGDTLKNGTTLSALTLERGFLGQDTPTYIAQAGMAVSQLQQTWQAKQKLTGSFTFMGLTGTEGTSPLDASPDAAPSISSYGVMAAGVNVGRIGEGGAAVGAKNWVRNLSFTLNNNLRMIDSLDSVASVAHGSGECAIEVTLETFFGSRSYYTKLINGTPTSANGRATKNSQALLLSFPRLTAMDGNPNATGKNTDVILSLKMGASYDSTTGAQILLQRTEYYED